ncbi:hypothetical protein OXPF_07620 [Oxobacter pfennigii]|uniref:Uncharacterized protein n=1 Tax=Oxobacter pfennigii TaxID=36849 RepID=A0A0P8YEA1_9CLOT|nr:hypothetical protein [Oxobacter pfennigii]KPU45529.1 hypothetical protein OXPF_07620 [Oxobacter pfennigii]
MKTDSHIEKILWSIAFPGFGQLLNGDLVKGMVFIALELIINIKSNLNKVIVLSFYGDIETAINTTDYQWLMFYPCIYIFAIWDAYKKSGDDEIKYSFLPFVISAYLGTIGVIYSPTFKIGNILLGPIWLPIICFFSGALIGMIIIKIMSKK